jgi:hypothetical protein
MALAAPRGSMSTSASAGGSCERSQCGQIDVDRDRRAHWLVY